jgi:hypothetical protein
MSERALQITRYVEIRPSSLRCEEAGCRKRATWQRFIETESNHDESMKFLCEAHMRKVRLSPKDEGARG